MNPKIYYFQGKNLNSSNEVFDFSGRQQLKNKVNVKNIVKNEPFYSDKQAFNNKDNKEKSDFSLYSFTTNSEIPAKNLTNKTNNSKNNLINNQNFLYDNLNGNHYNNHEVEKSSVREKIKSLKISHEESMKLNQSLFKEIENIEQKLLDKKALSEKKTETNNAELNEKIKFLEKELEIWQKKLQETEKNNSHEIAQIKLLFQNSFISSGSEIPEEKEENNKKILASEIREKIEGMIEKNKKLNKELTELLDELRFLKLENKKDSQDFINKIISKYQEEKKEMERNLQTKLQMIQREIVQIQNDNKQTEFIYNFHKQQNPILNKQNNSDEYTMKKLNNLENKNKELENELENIKLKYWNLEKKIQYDSLMGTDVKFPDEGFEKKIFQEENLKEKKFQIQYKSLETGKELKQKPNKKKEISLNSLNKFKVFKK